MSDALTPFEENSLKQDSFECKILPEHTAPGVTSEFKEYFTYDKDELRALSVEDCDIIATRLLQYSIYIQRCYNRDKSRAHYLKSEITRCIAPAAHKYPGQWELQREQATHDNEYTKKLYFQNVEIEQRLKRFYEMSNKIRELADQFKSLKFSKIKERE